ncbi:MAG TPA: hypothetical protein VGN74_14360 [Brevundimonas sp.]|jgi:hypothetical protein|uniref:hypothetical protein n=1 Tax=Brevundimonas sp. TaxID=1871086 RepID=UPI002E11B639|nr:hypothetical protein [Brevundimonas sp.]
MSADDKDLSGAEVKAHLKSISDKLTWGVIFLFIIMLNTCSLSDDIEDAIRDRGAPAAPAVAPEPAPATP